MRAAEETSVIPPAITSAAGVTDRLSEVLHQVLGAPPSRTRAAPGPAGTAAAESSTDWCVIACGTSISDSTPPSDSASENTAVAAAIRTASACRN